MGPIAPIGAFLARRAGEIDVPTESSRTGGDGGNRLAPTPIPDLRVGIAGQVSVQPSLLIASKP